ncbi:MAG: hypothetical protein SWH68_01950 [Thermodesulfobacteriota bacterium]|nr:hypothetical protein [Thermodesulfobacteriota bacterium]
MPKFIRNIIQGAVSVHANMFLPKNIQRRISEKKFVETVKNAVSDVPFYRQRFAEAGISAGDIHSLNDIQKLPFLSKEDVRNNFPENIVSKKFNINECYYSATTGSTGRSLPIIFSAKTFAYYLTTSLRVYTLVGYRPWHKIAYIKYTKVETPDLGPFFKTIHIPSIERIEEQIKKLKNSRANILTGYASIILELAKNVLTEDLREINLKFISVNSEMSTKSQRDYISNVFNCPVYDEYSTEETWMIASQCRAGSYHIFSDNVWIEFLDKDGRNVKPGETGEIIITTLNSPAMPLIRYKIGDLGVPGKANCSCGCGFQVLESFEGRADDSFVLPDGSFVSSLKLLNTFTMYIKKYLHLIEEFRIVQRTPEQVEIELVRGRDYSDVHVQELTASLSRILGDSVEIIIRNVDEITFEGIKRKAIESLV